MTVKVPPGTRRVDPVERLRYGRMVPPPPRVVGSAASDRGRVVAPIRAGLAPSPRPTGPNQPGLRILAPGPVPLSRLWPADALIARRDALARQVVAFTAAAGGRSRPVQPALPTEETEPAERGPRPLLGS
jgi:hypothetical protein